MDDIYKNIEEYNRNKKRKILIVVDLTAMFSNKKLNPIVAEFITRGRSLRFLLFLLHNLILLFQKID